MKKHAKVLGLVAFGVIAMSGLVGCEKKEAAKPAAPAAKTPTPAAPATPPADKPAETPAAPH